MLQELKFCTTLRHHAKTDNVVLTGDINIILWSYTSKSWLYTLFVQILIVPPLSIVVQILSDIDDNEEDV